MQIAAEFGIELWPHEIPDIFSEELQKFADENPEKLPFTRCIAKFRESITLIDADSACYWALQSSKHSDNSTRLILNSLCEKFIKVFSQFSTPLSEFLYEANCFYQAWERGCFEDCEYHLMRAWTLQTRNCPMTSILFGVCVVRLNEFKDRAYTLDRGGDRCFFPIIPKEEYIDFFEDWDFNVEKISSH